jgi:hypothetical protein
MFSRDERVRIRRSSRLAVETLEGKAIPSAVGGVGPTLGQVQTPGAGDPMNLSYVQMNDFHQKVAPSQGIIAILIG